MKKVTFAFAALLLICLTAFTQNCNMVWKDGSKTTLLIQIWTNPLGSDKKFLNAKEDKQAEMITAFNADVESGKIPTYSKSTIAFKIKKNKLKNADEYEIGYNVGGVDYFSYVVCKNDTLYLCRNRGPVLVGTKEDPLGYSLQGEQILPMNLKVGDALPSFEDIAFTFPKSTDITAKRKVFDGYVSQHSDYWGYGTDSRTGESGIGNFDVTTSKAVYKTIDVKVRQTVSITGHSLQGMNARVTGEEEVTVSGVKYKAYIIESESWTKPNLTVSYESADEEMNKLLREMDTKIEKKTEKLMVKKRFTNKLGYMVLYSKGWYVPQLGGSVKTYSYDIWGGISTVMTTTGLE